MAFPQLPDFLATRPGRRLARLLRGGPGLAGRIAVDATLLVLLVLAVGGFTSLLVSAYLLQRQVEEELAHEAKLISQRVEMALDNLQVQLDAMAGNPLTSNALTDTVVSRDAYLRPFLRNDSLIGHGVSIALLDFSGAVVSSVGNLPPAAIQAAGQPWFTRTLERNRMQARLAPAGPGEPFRLRLAAPVVYPASQQAEGALVLDADLGAMIDLSSTQAEAEPRFHAYLTSGKEVVAGSPPSLSVFKVSRPLALRGPYEPLGLVLEVGVERWAMLRPLLMLVACYALAGLAALGFVLAVAKRISARLTAPLVMLADNADEIRRSGKLDLAFPYSQDDEIGRLGESFRAMLSRLQAVQSQLESRVAERTRELKESQDKLSSLLHSLPDIVFSLAPDCQSCLYSSPAAERVLGPRVLCAGSPVPAFLARVHPADRLDMVWNLSQLQMTEETEFAFRAYRADDQLRWFSLRMHAIRDENGAVLRYDGIATDVTERRLAEERLRETEQRWKLAMWGTNDGIWDWDLRGGRIYFSARWKSMLGFSEDEISDDPQEWRKRIHPEDRPRAIRDFEDHLDRRTPLYVSEYRMLCKDGSYKWILSRGAAIWDETGKPARATGSHTDITERRRAEEALVAARLFAQSTLDGLTAHICVLDQEGSILSVNEAWRQFGLANGADPGRSAEGSNYLGICGRDPACMSDGGGAVAAGVRAVLAGRTPQFEMEYPCHSPTEQRWFLVRVSRLQGDGPGRVVVAHENITARKLAENALRESEERWRFALEGAGDGVWDWTIPSNGLILSKRWKEILEYAEDEIGSHFEEWNRRVHPEDKPRVLEALQKHLQGRATTYLAEYRLHGKTGWKWVLDRGMVVSRDEGGAPLRMLGTISDISQRKAMEAALQDRNEQLDTIFSLSPDGFVSFDREGQVQFANSAFFRMTGIDPDEVLKQPGQVLDRCLRRIAAGDKIYPGLDGYFALPGDEGQKEARSHFLTLSEPRASVLEIIGVSSRAPSVSKVLYVRDVTHETEVDRMKSEFLAAAAHELRTPMASIFGFTELLLTDDFDPETRRDLLQTIYEQTEMLVNIINELLDLARIEARRGKDFQLEPLDPLELVRASAASLQIDTRRWPLDFSLPPAAPRIRGDRSKLHQAFVNIIGNAVKYSPAGGGIAIAVSVRENPEGGSLVGFSIRDHGIGMTAEQSARIFERFYRADASGRIPGTGLGMSIVKEIIDLHGGRVEVASTPGLGTEIGIWLPAAAVETAPA